MTTERMVRADGLPENITYFDDGCKVAPHCLACPLPHCKYDGFGDSRVMRNRERDVEMRRLHDEGMNAAEIAKRYGIGRRTVWRVLAKEAPRAVDSASK